MECWCDGIGIKQSVSRSRRRIFKIYYIEFVNKRKPPTIIPKWLEMSKENKIVNQVKAVVDVVPRYAGPISHVTPKLSRQMPGVNDCFLSIALFTKPILPLGSSWALLMKF